MRVVGREGSGRAEPSPRPTWCSAMDGREHAGTGDRTHTTCARSTDYKRPRWVEFLPEYPDEPTEKSRFGSELDLRLCSRRREYKHTSHRAWTRPVPRWPYTRSIAANAPREGEAMSGPRAQRDGSRRGHRATRDPPDWARPGDEPEDGGERQRCKREERAQPVLNHHPPNRAHEGDDQTRGQHDQRCLHPARRAIGDGRLDGVKAPAPPRKGSRNDFSETTATAIGSTPAVTPKMRLSAATESGTVMIASTELVTARLTRVQAARHRRRAG